MWELAAASNASSQEPFPPATLRMLAFHVRVLAQMALVLCLQHADCHYFCHLFSHSSFVHASMTLKISPMHAGS